MAKAVRDLVDIGGGVKLDIFTTPGPGPLVFVGTHQYMHQTAELGGYAAVLAEHGTVIRPNLRSAGSSTPGKSPQELTMAQGVEDIEALRRALGHEQWIWFGWSAGGFIGLLYAQTHPSSLKGMIIGATAASGRFINEDSLYNSESPDFAETQRIRTAAYAANATPEAVRAWAQIMYHNPKAVEAAVAAAAASPNAPARRSMERSQVMADETRGTGGFKQFDYTSGLGRITTPTLVMAARYDQLAPMRWGEEVHRGIPGSEFVLFEHSGHSAFADEPDAYRATIESFLWRHWPTEMSAAKSAKA